MNTDTDSYEYVLYVDEAGDDVLKNLRPEHPSGASEWLVIAGYLVRREIDETLPERLSQIMQDIGARQARSLHYRDLSPTKRKRSCELIVQIPARGFAICSCKRTMLGHHNARAAAKSGTSKQYYYNFLVRLLLERATELCYADGVGGPLARPSPMKVIFSQKGGHHFGRLKAYIEQLKMQATGRSTLLNRRQIRPEVLRYNLVEYMPTHARAGLQMADVVASAFFEGVETYRDGWTVGPALQLLGIMAKEEIGQTGRRSRADFGVTLVPMPSRVRLKEREQVLFAKYGYIFNNPGRWR